MKYKVLETIKLGNAELEKIQDEPVQHWLYSDDEEPDYDEHEIEKDREQCERLLQQGEAHARRAFARGPLRPILLALTPEGLIECVLPNTPRNVLPIELLTTAMPLVVVGHGATGLALVVDGGFASAGRFGSAIEPAVLVMVHTIHHSKIRALAILPGSEGSAASLVACVKDEVTPSFLSDFYAAQTSTTRQKAAMARKALAKLRIKVKKRCGLNPEMEDACL